MRVRRMVAALIALCATAGCTVVVDGRAHAARGLKPRPLTGQTVNHVLLDEAELTKMLNQHFKQKPGSPARLGGGDQLYSVRSSPRECAGVVFELQKSSYGTADVRNVAQQSWWTAGVRGAKVISVVESVAAVPSAAAADAVFAQLIPQWNRCNGKTVTTDFLVGTAVTSVISDVRVANSVLAATVQSRIEATVASARAVGVRANCVVEVDIAFFSDQHPRGAAVDVAHRMLDKVSSLS
jgi:PknH-like extracellular domain